ncbi:hypothetical protein KKG58_05650, partial [Patescibacteria group bacterium]|nr:hypothetical protein [Patescibacteria group bacterium]
IKQEKLLPILTNLDVIPESALRLLESKYFLLTYKQNLALASEEIYNQYRKLKQEGDEIQLAGFIEKIKSQIESLISNKPQNPEISKQEHYQDLVQAVYPNHADNWTNYENNESCPDHSGDLEKFEIKDVYEIDLREGVEMEMKPGQEKDETGLTRLEKPIAEIQQKFAKVEFDKGKMFEILDKDIDEKIAECQNKEVFKTREEKIYGLLLEGLAGRQNPEDLKEILIGYQFAEFEDIKAYLEGTRAQTEQAKNPDYAYLLELREFFADHLKEVERRIASEAQNNQEISELLPAYYQEKKNSEQKRIAQEKLDKAQISKLGLTEGFLTQLGRTLKGKTGKDYSLEQIKRIAHLYETFSGGFEQKRTTSAKKRTKAFYGQLRSQREKSFKALQDIVGQEIEPENIHLGELNLQELLQARESFSEQGEYDEELFSRYLVQAFQSVFEDELSIIDQELAKYQPKEEEKRDKKQKQLECFITKNHTSAHARGVGGVCVAGDNPMKAKKAGRPDEECQWNLPNYFQMVLRDKETKICQGLILLRHYEDQGKKILTAAFDPSSTYLYAVDERQLFNSLLGQLETFAKDNDIDIIAVSQNKAMRTNRTGGEFERAMETAIRKANQNFSLSKEETFSFDPEYKQKDLDVVWVK